MTSRPRRRTEFERPVADDAGQPRLRAAARGIEAGRELPDTDEGVMHDVGGEPGLAGDAERDAVQASRLEIVQATERRSIPARAVLEQRRQVGPGGGVVQVGLVHRECGGNLARGGGGDQGKEGRHDQRRYARG